MVVNMFCIAKRHIYIYGGIYCCVERNARVYIVMPLLSWLLSPDQERPPESRGGLGRRGIQLCTLWLRWLLTWSSDLAKSDKSNSN